MQRLFNRIWNYFAKGVIGTTAICLVYPVSCIIVSIGSFIVGLLSPIWYVEFVLFRDKLMKICRMPIVTLVFHILQILFYDAYSAGN